MCVSGSRCPHFERSCGVGSPSSMGIRSQMVSPSVQGVPPVNSSFKSGFRVRMRANDSQESFSSRPRLAASRDHSTLVASLSVPLKSGFVVRVTRHLPPCLDCLVEFHAETPLHLYLFFWSCRICKLQQRYLGCDFHHEISLQRGPGLERLSADNRNRFHFAAQEFHSTL